ncbi:MAG: hypothetical protein ACTHZI_07105 [Luteimonas sp.]
MDVNWIALVLVVLGLYLAFKLIGAALRLVMLVVVLAGAYWFVAPLLGWPTLSDVVYVLGPDFEGQRIEEVFTPERIADGLGERVVDGVVERMRGLPELSELPELPEPIRGDGATAEEGPVEAAGDADADAADAGADPTGE